MIKQWRPAIEKNSRLDVLTMEIDLMKLMISSRKIMEGLKSKGQSYND